MFSFQTLHVLCKLQKILPKHCTMWPMSSYPFFGQCLRIFFWNLAILFSNSSLGSKNLKQNRYSLIKSKLTDLNNFIRKRVTAESNDFTSLLLFNGQHSKPYNKIGKHLHLTNSRTTSSEATLPTFPKIALVARKNPRLASSNEHLSDLDLTKCSPARGTELRPPMVSCDL